jgi:hypothetical protein
MRAGDDAAPIGMRLDRAGFGWLSAGPARSRRRGSPCTRQRLRTASSSAKSARHDSSRCRPDGGTEGPLEPRELEASLLVHRRIQRGVARALHLRRPAARRQRGSGRVRGPQGPRVLQERRRANDSQAARHRRAQGLCLDPHRARRGLAYSAWFPHPVHSIRVECVAKQQTDRFKRLCAEAIGSLEFH